MVGELKPMDDATGIIHWDIPYQPGQLTAEGCNANGEVESIYTIQTSGRPYAIRARVEEKELNSEQNIAHVVIEVVDERGIVVKQADNMITCTVEGPGRLLGLENSDNTDMTNHRDRQQRAYQGRLLAYVKATGEEGTIRISCTSPLLESAMAEIEMAFPVEKGTIASGKIWPDNEGEHINAHGGGVLYHNGTYYWYGEHKSPTTSSALVGVMCYSSKNLTDWKNEGAELCLPSPPIEDGAVRRDGWY
jgi:hypothetical protein